MAGMGRGSGRLARPSRPLLMEAPIDAARPLPSGTPRVEGIGQVARAIGLVAGNIRGLARVTGLSHNWRDLRLARVIGRAARGIGPMERVANPAEDPDGAARARGLLKPDA